MSRAAVPVVEKLCTDAPRRLCRFLPPALDDFGGGAANRCLRLVGRIAPFREQPLRSAALVLRLSTIRTSHPAFALVAVIAIAAVPHP